MMKIRLLLGCSLLLAILTSCTESEDRAPSAVDNGTWAFDGYMDKTVKPGDDFFMYCNGTWWQNTELDSNTNIKGFYITDIPDAINKLMDTQPYTNGTQISQALYFPPEDAAERGAALLQEAVDQVNAAKTREELWEVMGWLMKEGYQSPVYLLTLSYHGKLCAVAIPNEMDFTDMELPAMQVRRMQAIINDPQAEAHLLPVTTRGSRGASADKWPMIIHMCQGMGLNPEQTYVYAETLSHMVSNPDEMIAELQALQQLSFEEMRSLLLNYVNNDRETYNPDAIMSVSVMVITKLLMIYQNYDTSCYFDKIVRNDATFKRGEEMCEQLRQTFRRRLAANTWLSDGSKTAAIEKLDAIKFFVGTPGEFLREGLLDFTGKTSLLELIKECRRAFIAMRISLAGRATDQWAFHAIISQSLGLHQNNAAYVPNYNSIFIFPIWMLSPAYEEGANSAYNWATFVVIGHEMTHAFDTYGTQFDKLGDAGELWTSAADSQAFNEWARKLADYHSRIEVMPGVYANGQRTVNEDIADLGGFELVFQAYTEYLDQNGFYGEELRRQQRLFYQSYAHFWRARYNENYIKSMQNNEHSLDIIRVNALVPHTDAWYDLFDVKSGDKLYLSPAERVHIW